LKFLDAGCTGMTENEDHYPISNYGTLPGFSTSAMTIKSSKAASTRQSS
jgi:hypothetical protein